MKKLRWFAGLSLLLMAGVAVAEKADATATHLPQWFQLGLYIGPDAAIGSRVIDSTGNKITKSLGASATVDFASTTVGILESSTITVTGAKAGDPCFVGTPSAAGALKAKFECYVSAADTVKIKFTPMAEDQGTITLGGQSPSTGTATVTAGAVCTATIVGASAAIAAKGVAVGVSSTTLTVTSANAATDTVNFYCRAPVDPASGTYYVRVVSSQ